MKKRTFLLGLPAVLALHGCASAPQASPAIRQALAPTGKLRFAGLLGSPSSLVREPGGALRGVGYEVAAELARRLSVPLEVAEFGSFSAVVDALVAGKADVSSFNAGSARAKDVQLSSTLYSLESGYLVAGTSRIRSVADVDQPGVKVGVQQNSSSQALLAQALKQARVVPLANLSTVPDLLSRGEIDAFATGKPTLFDTSDKMPGSKVLKGRFNLEHQAIAVPRGREAAAAYLAGFVQELVQSGFVRQAAERVRLRGIVSA